MLELPQRHGLSHVRMSYWSRTRVGQTLVLVGLLAMVGTGCKSIPSPQVPQSIVGRWRGVESGVLLEFTETGIFVVDLKESETIVGRCSFVASRGTMRYQFGSSICPEEPGHYTFEIEGVNMRTADPFDTCVDRRLMMAQAWVREQK